MSMYGLMYLYDVSVCGFVYVHKVRDTFNRQKTMRKKKKKKRNKFES